MLTSYAFGDAGLRRLDQGDDLAVASEAGWVDLFRPTISEDKAAESFLGASIPTREEAQEIEYSSRFYVEDGAVFMTVSALTGVDVGKPTLAPFTIILAGKKIATLRYDDSRPFQQFVARATRPGSGCISGLAVLAGLVDAFIDRLADVSERLASDVDRINQEIFAQRTEVNRGSQDLERLIGDIGTQGDLAGKALEALVSLERLVQFATAVIEKPSSKGPIGSRLKLAGRDINSIEDHIRYLSNKISFLLDATLGLISLRQNNVIRVFTIATVLLFPPALIATVYGMNFRHMPELDWVWGYPMSIALMVVSAVLPYLYFRRRGWL